MSQQPDTTAEPKRETANTDRVFIFDTTLRDGEQCPGATMTFEEKLQVADFLDEMGVDIIEAGFPIASDGDFRPCRRSPSALKRAVVCGLSRAGETRHRSRRRSGEARAAAAHPYVHRHLARAPQAQAAEVGRAGAGDGALPGQPRAQLGRRRGMVGGGRHAHRDRLPVPLRGDRDQGGRHHHQPARYGGLCDAGGILPDVPHGDGAGAGLGEGDLLGALPQRSRHGGGQLAGRRAGRRAADRMHHQRHRRAGRQRGAGRDGDGDQDARRRAALSGRHRGDAAQPRVQAGGGGDLVPGAVQQGDRGPQRVRARERHPPGRHAQAHADLRDHDARESWACRRPRW